MTGNEQNIITDAAQVTANPDPIYDPTKIVAYMKGHLDGAKMTYSEEDLYQVARRADIKNYLRRWHVNNGLTSSLPSVQDVDSLFKSWTVQPDIEKKNQNLAVDAAFSGDPAELLKPKVVQSDLPSTPFEPISSSELVGKDQQSVENYNYAEYQKPITPIGDSARIDQEGYLSNIVDSLDTNLFQSSEAEAQLQLRNALSPYGFDVRQSTAGEDRLLVTRPDGAQMEMSLYPPLKQTQMRASSTQEYVARRVSDKIKEYKSFLNGTNFRTGRTYSMMDILASRMNASENLNQSIGFEIRNYTSLGSEDLSRLAKYRGGDVSYFMNSDGTTNTQRVRETINKARRSISKNLLEEQTSAKTRTAQAKIIDGKVTHVPGYVPPFPPQMRPIDSINAQSEGDKVQQRADYFTQTNKYLDRLVQQLDSKQATASKFVGGALALSKKYKSIDLFDMSTMVQLQFSGMDVKDLPTDGILINGNASSINSLQELVLDPTARNSIIKGDIKIEIDNNPEAYGFLAEHIIGAKAIIERNDAKPAIENSFGHSPLTKTVSEQGMIAFKTVGDWAQAALIGTGDILSYFGKTAADQISMIPGVSKFEAEQFVFGSYGLPQYRIPTPEELMVAKEKFLPLWNTQVSDAESFGAMMAIAAEPVGTSVPYYALFTANPAAGLVVTGVSSYGAKINQLDNLRKAARKAQATGQALTSAEKDLIELDDMEARVIALMSAGSETGFTALFTYPYFKMLKSAKNFAGVKNAENAKKIATVFSQNHVKSTTAKLARSFGVDVSALSREIPEENLIALTDYAIMTGWGLKEFDPEELNNLIENTTIISGLSSASMSRIARMGQSKNAMLLANGLIKKYMTLENESVLYQAKFEADYQLAEAEKKGKDSDEYALALAERDAVNADILMLNAMKDDQISNMPNDKKELFLEQIVQLEEQQNKLKDGTTPGIRRKVVENIGKIQQTMNDLLSNQPSEISYFFLDHNTKLKYTRLAENELEQENQEQGIEEYTLSDKEIQQRASELYAKAISDEQEANVVKFQPAAAYGVVTPESLIANVSQYDVKNFDLNTSIRDQRAIIFTPTTTEVLPEQQFTYDLTKAGNILDGLEQLNNEMDLMSHLPENQRQVIVEFFKDLKNPDAVPSFGNVQAIITAQNLANEMVANQDGKITVFEIPKTLDAISNVGDAYKAISNKFSKKLLFGLGKPGGFATTDMFVKMFLRNTNTRNAFLKLYTPILQKEAEISDQYKKAYNQEGLNFKAEVDQYNRQNLSVVSNDINSPENSYELLLAAGAFRQSGVVENGVDVEFGRWKSLVKQELDLRKQDYEGAETKTQIATYKKRYEKFLELYDRMGFEGAKSYSDLTVRPYIDASIRRIAEAQIGNRALERISDYGGKLKNEKRGTDKPFVDGTYIPIPMLNNTQSISQSTNESDGGNQPTSSDVDAPILNVIEFLENLGDMRLNAYQFAENVFMRMNGADFDVQTRDNQVALQYLLQNPTFKNLFENSSEYEMFKNFFEGKQEEYKNIATYGSNFAGDYTMLTAGEQVNRLANNATKFFYSTTAAVALARPSQRLSQFQSAVFNVRMRLKSSKAKNHLEKQNYLFYVGLAGASNGVAPKTKLGRFIQNSVLGRGDLSNIYAKSRTNLRNALKAEFQLGDDQKISSKYILDFVTGKQAPAELIGALDPMITINEFMNFLSSGNEKALDLFLASADRLAANTSFEALYMDAREAQGVDLSKINLNEWWKAENKNPNIEAINYADRIIAETMRQTGALSEAPLYNQRGRTQLALQMFLPFGRFNTNAKTAIATNYAIIKDPKVPESEKREAMAAIQGIGAEIAAFQATKHYVNLGAIKGFAAGILGFGLDDDDIQRYGGYSQAVGSMIGVEDRSGLLASLVGVEKRYQDFLSAARKEEKATKEGRVLATAAYREARIDDAAYFIHKFAMEYEKKFQAGKTYPILTSAIQDMFATGVPIPMFGATEDAFMMGLNKLLGEDIFTEYMAEDLDNAFKTKGGLIDYFLKHLTGTLGIGYEQGSKLAEALALYKTNQINTYVGEYGTQTNYVGAGSNPESIEKLNKSIEALFYMRVANIVVPGLPKAEFNRYLNFLQRAIENEYKVAYTMKDENGQTIPAPDPYMPTTDSILKRRSLETTEKTESGVEYGRYEY